MASEPPEFENVKENPAFVSITGRFENGESRLLYEDNYSKPDISLEFINDIDDGEQVYLPKISIGTDITGMDIVLGMDNLRNLTKFLNKSVDFCENNVNTPQD